MFSGNTTGRRTASFTSDKNCLLERVWHGPTSTTKPSLNGRPPAGIRTRSLPTPDSSTPPTVTFVSSRIRPRLALGFKPIDMTTVGLQGPEEWTTLPDQFEHRPYEAGVPADIWPLVETFEDYDVDEIPAGALPDEGGARVRITDQQAASGRQSMRFDDAAELTSWKPHWCQYFEPRDGVLRVTCSVLNDPDEPASINLEFRDWPKGSTYQTGPYLQFLPDGTVRVPGSKGWKVVGKFPPGEWLTIDIELVQGKNIHYNLRLTTGTGQSVTVKDLPMRSQEFERCNWLGFSGADTKAATFYVDSHYHRIAIE